MTAKRSSIIVILAVLFAAVQVGFNWNIRSIRPELGYVPTPPSQEFLSLMAMGDEQFLFRALAIILQNSGDTFGRFSPLKLYNYKDLSVWLELMDGLDKRSNYMPSLSAYYFSQTQNTKDVRYLVDYLYHHAKDQTKEKWWWLLQAIYLANHKLKDEDLALKVAMPLRNTELPVMAQQMLAIVYEKRGDFEQAFDIIKEIQQNVDDIPEKDLLYMQYFAEERLKRLEEYEEELKKLGKHLIAPRDLTQTPPAQASPQE